MTHNNETSAASDIDGILGERIKTGLTEVVKDRLNSDNIKLSIESGTKNGTKLVKK